MAARKTSMFTLTERLTISAPTTETTATIDLASYIDVADRQGLQIHSVDFIFQGTTPQTAIWSSFGAAGSCKVQVTDLNRGGLVFANDRALVASGVLDNDPDAFLVNSTDLYPDNYGKGSDDGRYVVNDQLYITGYSTVLGTDQTINVTVRVNCSVVSLSAKDFMAIAIQSTAADN